MLIATNLNYVMFHTCVVRQNQMHEVIRLCDQASWDPHHWNGHGGKLGCIQPHGKNGCLCGDPC